MARRVKKALRNLKIPSSQIKSTGVELGNGSYGKVFEVDYSGKLCAAKEVHSLLLQLASREGAAKLKDDFLRECHLWGTLRHPNVVQFLGIYYPSTDESGLPVMVLEKMQDSVTSLIEKHDNIPLLVKLSILHDVSLGLRYLHDHDPIVIHRDLSPNNILVTSHLEAKITDLGVAKVMMTTGGTKTLTKTPGTSVFMPPEALDDKPKYGPPLDVFSFGGVILYVTSRQWPTPKSWSQIDPKTKRGILLSEVERRQQYIDMMTEGDADLKPLVMSCLENDPELRPLATDVSERLKTLKEVCSTKKGRDRMDPFSWLAEIKQALLSTQLQSDKMVDSGSYANTQDATSFSPDIPPPLPPRAKSRKNKSESISGWSAPVPPPVAPRPKHHPYKLPPNERMKQPRENMVLNVSTKPDLLGRPVNIKWEERAPLPVASAGHTAVLFNGAIYVEGGACEEVNDACKINIYHPDINKWDDAIDTLHVLFAMTVIGDKLIIVGGVTTVKVTNKLLVLDSGHWKEYTEMPTARRNASAITHNSMMIVIGGVNHNYIILNTTELLDCTTGQWFICDDLPQPLSLLQSVIMDDTLYILGGATTDDKDSKAVYAAPLDGLSSHQLKWQQLADTPWEGSAAVSLSNKYLLVVGGKAEHDTVCVLKREKGSMITSASWQSIGSLPHVHGFSSAVSLANQIIVIGGCDQKECKHRIVTIGTLQ